MGTIKVLSTELISQIAAGEVIENPCSLLKELIENSLDAHCTELEIEIENAGLSKVKITDNGEGILKEDLPQLPIKHATSKISIFDDLYAISTLGFRGEALASLFSVAKVRVQSKTASQESAYEISNHNNTNYTPIKTAHNNGTTITVTDLFYNVPARKKFLKSEQLEFKQISEMIKKVLLVNPSLKCKVIHNSKVIIDKKYETDFIENCYSILQIPKSTQLYELNKTTPNCIIKGTLADTNELSYATNNKIHCYVNSRPVFSSLIQKAILHGISTNITLGRFPLCIIDITIDPQLIDVNIHPSKKIIKFEQEHSMYENITLAIEEIFKSNLHIKNAQLNASQFPQDTSHQKILHSSTTQNNATSTTSNTSTFSKISSKLPKPTTPKNYSMRDSQQELNMNILKEEHKHIENDEENNYEKHNIKTPRISSYEIDSITPTYGPLYEYLKEYRIIGQLHKTYILIETAKGLLIIDQHVAQEKFYYELFKQEYKSHTSSIKKSHTLLEPKIISLTQEEMIHYTQYNEYFAKLGFEIDTLSQNQIIIRSMPLDLKGKSLPFSIIIDILHSFEEFSNSSQSFENFIIEHLSILSCKSSIRAGEELTHTAMKETIEQLKILQEPFNCPHGRPILVEFSLKDLHKMFKRH